VQPRHRGSRNGEEAAAGVDDGGEISKGQGGRSRREPVDREGGGGWW
jgi:hypothetical protein